MAKIKNSEPNPGHGKIKTKRRHPFETSSRFFTGLERETILFSLQWQANKNKWPSLLFDILLTAVLIFLAGLLLTEAIFGKDVLPSILIALLFPPIIIVIWSQYFDIGISTFYVSLTGLHVILENGRQNFYAYETCSFKKEPDQNHIPTFKVYFEEQPVFTVNFKGRGKDLDELLHALATGAERSQKSD